MTIFIFGRTIPLTLLRSRLEANVFGLFGLQILVSVFNLNASNIFDFR